MNQVGHGSEEEHGENVEVGFMIWIKFFINHVIKRIEEMTNEEQESKQQKVKNGMEWKLFINLQK